MIREEDLLEAIAECQGERNPNAQTCRNLAAYYTILDHVRYNPRISNVMGLMDELMDTLQVIQPRLYDAVMRKLKEW